VTDFPTLLPHGAAAGAWLPGHRLHGVAFAAWYLMCESASWRRLCAPRSHAVLAPRSDLDHACLNMPALSAKDALCSGPYPPGPAHSSAAHGQHMAT
jgi:hypothetical protein